MTIYHPGKVVAVYSSGNKDVIGSEKDVQVLVEMWDENLFTCDVAGKIADKIKEEDIVLVDYSPLSTKITIPKHVVTKIIRGKTAEKTWDKYKEMYNKKRREEKMNNPQVLQKPPIQLYG